MVQTQGLLNRLPKGSGQVPEKVMGLWRKWVKFNRVLEQVPEKVWENLVQTLVRFSKVPDEVPEKVSEKVLERAGGL